MINFQNLMMEAEGEFIKESAKRNHYRRGHFNEIQRVFTSFGLPRPKLVGAKELFGYAGALICAMVVFLLLARGYSPRSLEPDASSTESSPLLRHRAKVISVHSLSALSSGSWSGAGSARGRGRGRGLGRTRRSQGWPLLSHAAHRATVHRR
ncbi:hypothetical protein EVAR_73673_1 [Eumeta japonica]|uniref:Uncharacterized protein n=1 Tax=Eumeta variegata TaxID=151549 RepID=A0A4C1T2F1_EUMVA|nr:hypothetical protein EVAR_73673_1 [Eumeta japonica]